MKVWLDFESYSELDLTEVGPIAYAQHPSTSVLCMSWRTDTEDGFWVSEDIPHGPTEFTPLRRLFNTPSKARLTKILQTPNVEVLVEAHNAMVERCIWNWHMVLFHDFPEIRFEQWRCSAARAAACSLPRALGDAGRALNLDVVKDEETGSRLIAKLCKPGRDGLRQLGTKEEWEEFYNYCEGDTAAEQALSKAIPELSPKELRVWQMDQRTNLRGFRVDIPGAKRAVSFAETWTKEQNEELRQICASSATNGQKATVERATQRDRLKAWLHSEGVYMPNMQAITLDYAAAELEKKGNNGPAKRAIEILRSIGRSSTAKFQTCLDSQFNGRLHDTLMYHGASTGRWTAKRFQPHNMPRGKIKDMPTVWRDIMTLSLTELKAKYGDIMTLLSHAARGLIIPDEGFFLHAGDYAAIETRVLFWMADELEGLATFARNEDIYCKNASEIYGRLITKLSSEQLAEDNEARQLGKQYTLGLGFQMAYVKFLLTCRHYKMKFSRDLIRAVVPSEEIARLKREITSEYEWNRCLDSGMTEDDIPELIFMKYVVEKYRIKYADTVVALWSKMQEAAHNAVRNPGKAYTAGKVRWYCKQSGGFTRKWDSNVDAVDGFGIKGGFVKAPMTFLIAELPSGRKLVYPDPELEERKTTYKKNGETKTKIRITLSYMAEHATTKQWVREDTYGGKLVENCVQATARDVMAEAKLRCENSPFTLLLSVHDEVIAQSRTVDVEGFTKLIAQVPEWAPGLPVKAESWAGSRYFKK